MNGYILEGEMPSGVEWQPLQSIDKPVSADKTGYYSGIGLNTFDDLFKFYHFVIYPHYLTGVPAVINVESMAALNKKIMALPDPQPVGCTLTAEKAIRHLRRIKVIKKLPDNIEFRASGDIEYSLPLDEDQTQAAIHYTGVATVVAPAGSGKTATIVARCVLLIKRGIKPEKILTITFTKKAQLEMQERLIRALGDDGKKITVKTFHALAYMLIHELTGKKPDIIIDRLPHILEYVKENSIDLETFNSYISYNLNSLISPDSIEAESEKEEIFLQGYTQYLSHLEGSKTYDQDYLLYKLYELLKNSSNNRAKLMDCGSNNGSVGGRWHFVMVDESQDNNLAQEIISQFIAAPWDNLYYVGDDDQLLYTFRGSSVERILNINELYPNAQEIFLRTNYRSHPAIVWHANELIKHNTKRKVKNIKSGRTDIDDSAYPISCYTFDNPVSEACWVANKIKALIDEGVRASEVAILYRTNAQSDVPANELFKLKVPYYVHQTGRSLFESGESEAIISYLSFIKDQNDTQALGKILKYHSKEWMPLIKEAKKSKYVIDALRQAAQDMDEYRVVDFCNTINTAKLLINSRQSAGKIVSYVIDKFYLERIFGSIDNSDRLRIIQSIASKFRNIDDFMSWVSKLKAIPKDTENTDDKVQLMTVHSSKGMEFSHVFMINLTEGCMPHAKSTDIEEERRIAYVGITRAQDRLTVTGYSTDDCRGISRFVSEAALQSVHLPDMISSVMQLEYEYKEEDPETFAKAISILHGLIKDWDTKDYPDKQDKCKALCEALDKANKELIENKIEGGVPIRTDPRLRNLREPEKENIHSVASIVEDAAKQEFISEGQHLLFYLESLSKEIN